MNGNTLEGFEFTVQTVKLLNTAEGKGYDAWAHACKEGAKANLDKRTFFDALRNASAMRFNDSVLLLGLKLANEGMNLTDISSAMRSKAEERAAKERVRRAEKSAKQAATEEAANSIEEAAKVGAALNGSISIVSPNELLNGIDKMTDTVLVQYLTALETAVKMVRKEIKHRAEPKAGNMESLLTECHPLTAEEIAKGDAIRKAEREARKAEREARKAQKVA